MNKREKGLDVLIVGAGPVGLTLAIGLTRLGLMVRIVEKATQSKREQRACVIWPRAAEIFRDLQVIDQFTRVSGELHSNSIYSHGHRVGGLELGFLKSAYRYPLIVEQQVTEEILREQLERLGVGVEYGCEALDLEMYADRVTTKLRRHDGTEVDVTSDWIVGCEGTRSMVREKLGIPFVGERRTNLQALQINAVPKWRYPYSSTHGYFFLKPHISLGVYPLPTGGYRFFAFTTDTELERRDAPTVEEMRALVADAAHAPEVLLEPMEPLWLSRARFQDRIARHLRQGRALLAGDAAHAWAPIGGHGMNAGIRGAHNLAWKLAAVQRGDAHEALLDSYDVEQRAAAQAVMDEMRFNILEVPLSAPMLFAAQVFMSQALKVEGVHRMVEYNLSDLGMHHRKSQLSWQRTTAKVLHAGDRIPDVLVNVSGEHRKLHELLAYDHWTLLLVGESEDDDVSLEDLKMMVGRYRTKVQVVQVIPKDAREFGASPRMVLVRPDGHIGLMAGGGDKEYLEQYMKRFFWCGGSSIAGRGMESQVYE